MGASATVPPTAGAVSRIACLTEQACDAARADAGYAEFRVDANDSFPARGCFAKNERAYFSPGTTAEMSTADVGGVRTRLYCGSATVALRTSNVETLEFVRVADKSAGAAARAGMVVVVAAVVGALL